MPRQGECKPPPDHWVEKKLHEGLSLEKLLDEWSKMTRSLRRSVIITHINSAKRLHEAEKKVADGTATPWMQRYVERMHRGHKMTAEEVEKSKQDLVQRTSTDHLEFILSAKKGCIVEGCRLGPLSGDSCLLRLLELDHVDPSVKISQVGNLRGEARNQELLKTQCLCTWHHHLKTREHMQHRVASDREASHAEWGKIKEQLGCQHPLHAKMGYASMLPSPSEDKRFYAFLDLSHRRLGFSVGYVPLKLKMEHLLAKEADIFCRFCHLLWTSCERGMMYDTPTTQYHYTTLLRRYPAFVQYFDEITVGVDWVAQRQRRDGSHKGSHEEKKEKKVKVPGKKRGRKPTRIKAVKKSAARVKPWVRITSWRLIYQWKHVLYQCIDNGITNSHMRLTLGPPKSWVLAHCGSVEKKYFDWLSIPSFKRKEIREEAAFETSDSEPDAADKPTPITAWTLIHEWTSLNHQCVDEGITGPQMRNTRGPPKSWVLKHGGSGAEIYVDWIYMPPAMRKAVREKAAAEENDEDEGETRPKKKAKQAHV